MLRTEVLALDSIEPNPDNPRKAFDDKELATLAATFAMTPDRPGEPFTPPIVVKRPGKRKRPYMLIDGERRWRAMREAGQVGECTCTVADSMDEANALLAMICTDSKEPLTDEEKSVGVQQALLLELDDETVEAAAMLPAGSAAKVRRVVSRRGKPVQGSLELLFEVGEIEDDDLLEQATEAADNGRSIMVRELKVIQSHRRAREELVGALDHAGVPVYTSQEDIPVPEGETLSYAGTAWYVVDFDRFDLDDIFAAVVEKNDEEGLGEDFRYRPTPKATLYTREDSEEEDADEGDSAERDRLREEAAHELSIIEAEWAGFVLAALADGRLEYDPDLDEPSALQQLLSPHQLRCLPFA